MTQQNTTTPDKFSVVIADDHQIIRDAISDLLQQLSETTTTNYHSYSI